MALTLIGFRTIRVGDGWVEYPAIALAAANTFLLEILTQSTEPDNIYSRFLLKYRYPTQSSPESLNLDSREFFYEPVRQSSLITIPSLLAPTGNLQLYVRRIPLYSNPTNLSDVVVFLAYDPVIVT